jgi:hypothetical protein
MGKLLLVFKVTRGPDATQHGIGVLRCDKRSGQSAKALDLNVIEVGERLLGQRYPLLSRKQRFFTRALSDTYDHPIKQDSGTLD